MGGAYARLCRRDDREHRLPGCTACRQPGSSHRRPARVRRDDPGCAGPGDGSVTGDRLQHRPRAAGRRPRRCPRQCRPSGSASPLLKSAPPRTPAARRPPRSWPTAVQRDADGAHVGAHLGARPAPSNARSHPSRTSPTGRVSGPCNAQPVPP